MESTPHTLAAFRVAVGAAVLFSTELHAGPRFAALPAALRVAPEGLGWFAHAVPVSEPIARAALAVAVFGAVATLVGVYARLASAVLLAATFYLLAAGQLGGTVLHDMHLVWFVAVLAASPCADVWSVDAWWARREGRPLPLRGARAYGLPVWTARALLACVYFFPGLHKVLAQGPAWASAGNLAAQLRWKWFEWGEVPGFRLDEHPALLVAGGVAVLAFELGFPLLLATRRTRAVAAVGGVAFHLATQALLRIPFSSLWLCYPVLLEWPLRSAPPAGQRAGRAPAAAYAVCAALLAGAVVQGLRGKTDAFPFACYPTFAPRPADEIPDLRIVAVDAGGSAHDVPHARGGPGGVRAQVSWGRVWSLAGVTAPVDRGRLLAYAALVRRADPRAFDGAERVEMRRAFYAVVPEARGEPPVREDLLATFALAEISSPAPPATR